MNVARPARRVLGQCLATSRAAKPATPCHQFHSSAPRPKRRSRFRNIAAEELGLTKSSDVKQYQDEKFPGYSPEEIEQLKEKYTPEQADALLAGEKAIDPSDLLHQGRLRRDWHRPGYVDDYAQFDPRYDLKPEEKVKPSQPEWLEQNDWVVNYARKITEHTNRKADSQITRAMVRALQKVKESQGADLIDLTDEELHDIDLNPSLAKRYMEEGTFDETDVDANASGPEYMTREQAENLDKAIDIQWEKELSKLTLSEDTGVGPIGVEDMMNSSLGVSRYETAESMELGKVPGVVGQYVKDEETPLSRLTGMSGPQLNSLYNKVLVDRYVSNQTRLGKIRSSSVLAVAGNGNGWLGLGMAKSAEPGVAPVTAKFLAIKNMKPIRRYENRTIFGNVKAKVSGAVVEIYARPPGFGLRCPHRLFEMCRAAGIHDIAARMPRSKNPMNSVKAMYQALMDQPNPEEIAIGRGKKMVDVRKVYYGGSVH